MRNDGGDGAARSGERTADGGLDRRELLRLGAGLGGAALAGGVLLPGWSLAGTGATGVSGPGARLGVVVGPGPRETEDGPAYHLSILDLDGDRRSRRIELDYLAHGVCPDPTNPARAVIFEKRGRGASEVDLANAELIRPITGPPEREFYGHGAFSPDGSLVYATESVVTEGYRGVVVVRDGKTLEELGEFPTYGASPHDCVLRDGGKTFVVTNGGSQEPGGQPGSVTYVDVATEKLIEKVELENPTLNAGHLALSDDGDLAVVSTVRDWMPRESLGAASFRPAGAAKLRTMVEPLETTRRMIGESLSVSIHEPSGIVGVTNPRGNLVTFWHLKRGELVATLDLSRPRGIALTLDGRNFVVSYGESTSLLLVAPETGEPIPGSRIAGSGMGGSHVIVHELA